MGTEELKALQVTGPTAKGDAATNSDVLRVTTSTTAGAIQIPDSWLGCYIQVKCYTSNAYVYLLEAATTPSGSALPDATKAAADPQLGWKLAPGESEPYLVPARVAQQNHIYLAYDADGAGELWIRKASKA